MRLLFYTGAGLLETLSGTFKTADGRGVCLLDSGYGSYYVSGKYFYPNLYNYGDWNGCDLHFDVLGREELP